MKCPRCSARMETVQVEGVRIERCTKWLRVAAIVFVVAALTVGGCRRAADTHQPVSCDKSVQHAPQPASVQAQPAPRTTQQKSDPVVTQLKTRDNLIVIRTGPHGPLYTIKSNDGQILAVDLPAAEISAKFPQLKDVVERGVTDWAGRDFDDRPKETLMPTAPIESYKTGTITIEQNTPSEGNRR